ncbi:hypothetical protein BC936DRAFT_143782 [Jimgerdemannia flammicorona]|uniref:Uncharacterized protein n=1 Tax=Jimgerdemannia flammicorona TaxID=994334 RepID=A0A432ZZ02_9FUNG|nr:hypothetical protein BC936DRAFT_143782 [Jimgerdemannia flammicorona]
MNPFNSVGAGLGGITFVILIAFVLASMPLNIYNIVNASNGLKMYPDKEPCSGGDQLHTFLIGVIVCSSLSLINPMLACCSSSSSESSANGNSSQSTTVSTSGGFIGLFLLVWVILGK